MKSLKILFIIRSAEHFLRYDSIIGSLCAAGHKLTVLFDKEWSGHKDLEQVEEFKKNFPALDYGWLLNRDDSWAKVLFVARSLLTYRRYLIIESQSSFFVDRWKRYMPFWLRIPLSSPLVKSILGTEWIGKFLYRLENSAPPCKKIYRQIQELAPDVLISPVGGIRVMSPNTEYLKGALALGVPTASPTISWDSLTTKALITVFPDIFLLWNDFHKKQAIEHHNAPQDRIRIIGAPVFDKWFAGLKPSKAGSGVPQCGLSLKPSLSRKEFSKRYGLKSDKPYILYLGSAAGTAENETWLIRELRKSLDNSSDQVLRELQIVVRPHPSNAEIYKNFSLSGAVLAPKGRATPDEELQLSFDTYYHAVAAVGIFTSAMMEAQIMGKPVIVILSDQYKKTQLEAHHFQDFIRGDSLELVNNLGEFQIKIKEILAGKDTRKEKRKNFVVNYIRPLGIGKSAGMAAVEEIEKLASRKNVNKI